MQTAVVPTRPRVDVTLDRQNVPNCVISVSLFEQFISKNIVLEVDYIYD